MTVNKSILSKALLLFALGAFSTLRAQDIEVSRALTAEEKAFDVRTRKQLFDLIVAAQKGAFGNDYELADPESELEPNAGVDYDRERAPYSLKYGLRFTLNPGTARYNKVQGELEKFIQQAATLNSPEEAAAMEGRNPSEYLDLGFNIYVNDDAHIEFISFRKNAQKLTKPGARYVVRGEGATVVRAEGATTTAFYFGHFGPLREEEDVTPGSKAFAATPKFNPQTPRLAVQSILLIITAPHDIVDAFYSKLNLTALQGMIAP